MAKKFERRDVIGSRIAITGAGDGLSDSLDVAPIELHHGDEVLVLLRASVRDIAFPPAKKGLDVLVRKHTLSTESATLLTEPGDVALAEQLLAAAADRVSRARDSMVGQGRLDDEADV